MIAQAETVYGLDGVMSLFPEDFRATRGLRMDATRSAQSLARKRQWCALCAEAHAVAAVQRSTVRAAHTGHARGRHQSTCRAELSGKMLLIMRMLWILRSKTTDRIVIVSNYTQTLDVLVQLCRNYQYPHVRLDGKTSVNKRQVSHRTLRSGDLARDCLGLSGAAFAASKPLPRSCCVTTCRCESCFASLVQVHSAVNVLRPLVRQRLVDKFNDPTDDQFVFLLSSKVRSPCDVGVRFGPMPRSM